MFVAFLTILSALAVQNAIAADTGRGADVFETQCAECHSIKPGKNKKGPSLAGVVGRAAGGVADYAYSDAMKANGLPWTPDRLDAYVSYPRKLVPGTKMKYDGLGEARERADLIAFLAEPR
jgi:cytochrome c